MRTERPSLGLTIGQVLVSALAVFGFWTLAALLAGSGLGQYVGRFGTYAEAASSLIGAAAMGFIGLLFLPSILFAFLRLIQAEPPAWLSFGPWSQTGKWLLWALVPFWAGVLALGSWVSNTPRIGPLLLPPLYVLAVSLPIVWLLLLGSRGLSAGSPQRTWGLLNAGMLAGPFLSLLAELFVLILVLVVVVIVVARDPALTALINQMTQGLTNSNADPEALMKTLQPYLTNPAVIITGLALVGGLFPLLEELFKPVGLWFLLSRRLTPAEGFVGGMLSGAGFTLLESLGMTSNASGSDWALVAGARGATDLVHILCSGLVGWGLVSAWKDRNFLRLGLVYLAAAAIHGTWNTLSLLVGIIPLVNLPVSGLPRGFPEAGFGIAALAVLIAIMLLILTGLNRRLRRPAPADASIAPLPITLPSSGYPPDFREN